MNTGSGTIAGTYTNVKGLDGVILDSKLKMDYTKGLIWQIFTMKDLTWDDYL